MAARFIQLKLIGPVLAGLAMLITGLAAIPYYGVETVDANARSQQETLVERNVAMSTPEQIKARRRSKTRPLVAHA
ncbi:hypothetical protein [Rhizobium sp. HT1-10]|uniref:hypothetical protein n=1 Tax=Rhizobium sp. HT1-10 TaxID=3111638 RepID=UPI003C2517B9